MLKKKFLITSLLFGVIAVLVACLLSTQYALANNSNGKVNQKDYELSEKHHWSSWEVDVINDSLRHLTNNGDFEVYLSRETEIGSSSPVTRVADGTKFVHRYEDGKDDWFEYDIKGYFGNCWDCFYREPNVQFFYNTNTKQLCVLGFGWEKHKYETYNYSSGTSILEDDLIFGDGTVVNIAKECKSVEFGTQITKISKRSCQNMYHCTRVDIVGGAHGKSSLEEISDHAFDNTGVLEVGPFDGVDMSILHAKDINSGHSIRDRGDWAGNVNIDYRNEIHRAAPIWRGLDSEELVAYNDFYKKLEATAGDTTYPEEPTIDSTGDFVYHVVDNKFNIITVPAGNTHKTITYNIRGFFGDWTGMQFHRKSQIQFFYNTETKEMNVVTFDCKLKYKTNQYTLATKNTIFQDELKFASGYKCVIGDGVETLYIDPRISEIETASFQKLFHLKEVDFMENQYECSKLTDLDGQSFGYCGTKNSEPVKFKLFRSPSFDESTRGKLLRDFSDDNTSWRCRTEYVTE